MDEIFSKFPIVFCLFTVLLVIVLNQVHGQESSEDLDQDSPAPLVFEGSLTESEEAAEDEVIANVPQQSNTVSHRPALVTICSYSSTMELICRDL